jgi:putative ABC transport system permease protein
MTTAVLDKAALQAKRGWTATLPVPLRLALREFRGGLNGFYVFIACIALGVAVITGVGALGDALRSSFERQGATLLGGDVTLARPHQRASAADRAWINAQGRASEVATVRAMARRLDQNEQVLVEIKGIDAAYPLVGTVRFSGEATSATALLGGTGVVVDPIILDRLNLKLGDTLQLGATEHVIRATIEAEPDKLADRLSVGPRIFIATTALEKTSLIDAGSLVGWRYAIALKDPTLAATAGLATFAEQIKAALPEGGYTIRDRRDPSPSVTRTLERLRQFLTLLGLTSLLVGGVGVANAVSTYIDRRRPVIATLKAVGATTRTIFLLHLTQVMLIAGIGVAIGLVLGMLIPVLVSAGLGPSLPIQADITIRPLSLLTAALYGMLVALAFTLWPLGRAEQVRATALFRDDVAPESVRPRPAILVALAVTVVALFALAILGAEAKKLAAYFSLAVVGVLSAFLGLGILAERLARMIKRPRRPEYAIAIGNIGAPGGLARSVVLSLGTGLSLLVAVALVDRAITGELAGRIPETSPNYFVLDIKKAEVAAFEALIRRLQPQAELHTAPMLRGRIVKVNDTPSEKLQLKPEHQWVLNGDRGLSYSETVPDGSTVKSGTWWDAKHTGEPLVSFERELANGLGLKVGDSVTVNVLGRNVTARVANLRDVKWESLALNFVMVFSPNTLQGAPHNVLATVTLPKDAPLAAEAAVAREIGKAFPATSAIRVKDAINQFNAVFGRIMTAVRAAGSITLAAGALVLAGALATAQRRRIKQAVILKALGATRRRILTAHAVEYALLAAFTALIAVVIGSLCAYITVKRVMDLSFVLSPWAIAQALGLALLMVGLFGGFGTWRVLGARPVPHLRAD